MTAAQTGPFAVRDVSARGLDRLDDVFAPDRLLRRKQEWENAKSEVERAADRSVELG